MISFTVYRPCVSKKVTPPTFTVDPDCSHRPYKRTPKASKKENNTREGRKHTKRSKEFLSSLSKARNQPFYLQNNSSDVMSPSLVFYVYSLTSKQTYQVQIKRTPSCTCYHFIWKERSRAQVCKHLISLYLCVLGVSEDNDIIMQVSLTDRELVELYDGDRLVPINRIGSQPTSSKTAASSLEEIEIEAILLGAKESPQWSVLKLTIDKQELCASCDISRMIRGRLAVVCDGMVFENASLVKKRFFFCARLECLKKKPRLSNLVVPPTSIQISKEEGVITKEDQALLAARNLPIF